MKICRRCKKEKKNKDDGENGEFRIRPNGFELNQCKSCESEMNKARRLNKLHPEVLTITTKSGKEVKASITPIAGGCITTSVNSDKVLYFDATVNRDLARVAYSSYAGVVRTGISYQKV